MKIRCLTLVYISVALEPPYIHHFPLSVSGVWHSLSILLGLGLFLSVSLHFYPTISSSIFSVLLSPLIGYSVQLRSILVFIG